MTHNIWILDASPVILLAKVGYAHLLLDLPASCYIPQAVAEEIMRGPSHDPARLFLEEGRVPIVEVPFLSSDVLAWNLGPGETAVISYALAKPNATVILDDMAARKCAKSLGVRVKGTLGVVVLAKRKGLVPSAATIFRDLLAVGARFDDALARYVLQQIGERWD